MATVKPVVIYRDHLAGGRWHIFIRITHKRKSRYLPTSIYCDRSELTRTGKIRAELINRCRPALEEVTRAVEAIPLFEVDAHDVDWIISRIRATGHHDGFALDLFDFGEEWAQRKSPATRRAYTGALNALARYLGRRTLDVNDIDKKMVLAFADYIDAEPKLYWSKATRALVATNKKKMGSGLAAKHVSKLAAIFNAAKDRYNDEDAGRIVIPRSPFAGVHLERPPARNGQRSIGQELMQQVISDEDTEGAERRALDIFVISFALMGANLADLYTAPMFAGDTWTYYRKKTRTRRADMAKMVVRVPACIGPHIGRLAGDGGEWWLGALHNWTQHADYISSLVNRALARWCERHGVPTFTFYAARHTWATLARNAAKIDKATVDECLCHVGDMRLADIYIERDWSIINDANARVLALFEWPQKNKGPL